MRANKPHLNRIIITGAFSTIILLLVSCGGGEPGSGFASGTGSSFSLSCTSPFAGAGCIPTQGGGAVGVVPTCNSDETGIVDACGVALTGAIDLHDPVAMSVSGLTANTRHTIVITDPLAAEITPAGGLIAISDSAGAINKAIIVQNMPAVGEVGLYAVAVAVEGGATVQTLNYMLENRSRVQCIDNANNPQASFLAGETVFAKIDRNDGSLADGTYRVYVISDAEKALADGGLIGGAPVNVVVTGGTGTVSLGTFTSGTYDVLVDVNGNGVFNQGTDLISRHNRLLPCFAMQSAGAVTVQQIASDKNGNKREIFDPNADIAAIRDIQAFVTPAERSAMQQPGSVRTYLVNHQATWSDGDALAGVAAGAGDDFKVSPVQNDSNSEAPWVLATYTGLAALGGTTCYDVVVDTNGNGNFDAGTDYVDNVDHLGGTACGVRVSTASCTNVNITSHANNTNLTDTAITLAGTITGLPTEAYVTITAGEQSTTIAISLVGNNFSLNVPLFAGDNHITVYGIYADNSSCSQTITLTSLTDLALFRAQLTWDGDTDMDLHVVRAVSGTGTGYSNGGGGADDCNFSSCSVGLSGTGSNGISWGTGGEEDDPKLDVDCISCGNGIENIWMNQITEDGNYEVYVDAFSGSETDVTVTISILGTAVAQVNCGSMVSDTATDSCFVGTITWAGGTNGTGSFTPSGITAADF
ncbi:MAG: hypothetical protein GXP18_02915 [Gammaproteobacteria bacterium]|nr:hypothetical protein [Gammaproteobacteria bacterium]